LRGQQGSHRQLGGGKQQQQQQQQRQQQLQEQGGEVVTGLGGKGVAEGQQQQSLEGQSIRERKEQ
jgi:hypothetical protein